MKPQWIQMNEHSFRWYIGDLHFIDREKQSIYRSVANGGCEYALFERGNAEHKNAHVLFCANSLLPIIDYCKAKLILI